MSICVKCNRSIKPASLATNVGGESFHPTCISCGTCGRPLWGREFKKAGKALICAEPCQPPPQQPPPQQQMPPPPQQFPQSVPSPNQMYQPPPPPQQPFISRPSSAQRQQELIMEYQRRQMSQLNPYLNKSCKICNQTVANKRYITFENGDVVCQNCEMMLNQPPPNPTCSYCNTNLNGIKYYTDPNGVVTCERCEKSSERCKNCHQLFKFTEHRRKAPNGDPYHLYCFKCTSCHLKIDAEAFYVQNSVQPLCANCHKQFLNAVKCNECNQPIIDRYLTIEQKTYHHTCFKCKTCGNILNSEVGYFKHKISNEPICGDCNSKLFGIKCIKCSNVIEKDGVTFADHDYHQGCFKCDKCGVELVKMKRTLTDKNGLIYCEPCHLQEFAPKCGKCNMPITTTNPGVQVEDKVLHRECFLCARCKKTMANKRYFKSGNLVVCESCN